MDLSPIIPRRLDWIESSRLAGSDKKRQKLLQKSREEELPFGCGTILELAVVLFNCSRCKGESTKSLARRLSSVEQLL